YFSKMCGAWFSENLTAMFFQLKTVIFSKVHAGLLLLYCCFPLAFRSSFPDWKICHINWGNWGNFAASEGSRGFSFTSSISSPFMLFFISLEKLKKCPLKLPCSPWFWVL